MANALSVRPRLRRWTIDDEVYLADGSYVDFESACRLVILIHGYNNSEADARRAFAKFRARVGDAVPRRELWEFHWPGDHPKRLVSRLTYPVRVRPAEDAGERLASFLAGLTHVDSVSIVAHSLGCRVALNAIAKIRELETRNRGAAIQHVFLLAAAVPVPLCDGSYGRFPGAREGSEEHVFYSRSDFVLWWGFPRAQSKIGPAEEGEAVGRHGDPIGRWYNRRNTGLGHTKYWEAKIVSREIVQRLGPSQVRDLDERPLVADGVTEPARPLESSELPRRTPRERWMD